MVKTMLSCATTQEGMRRPQGGHFQDVCGELSFSHVTEDPALAVLACALGDIEKPSLTFLQLTFTKIFLVTIWLETILALITSRIAMRPKCGSHIGPFKDFIITM